MRTFFSVRTLSTVLLVMVAIISCWKEPQFEFETHEVEVKQLESEIIELQE